MSKFIHFFVLIALLLLLPGRFAARAQEPDGAPSFAASVCRLDNTGGFRVTIEISVPDYVGFEIDWSFDDFRGLEDWYWVQPDYPAEIELELSEGMWPNGLTVSYQPDAPELLTYHFALDESTPGCGPGEGEPDQPCDPSAGENATLITFTADAELLWAPDSSAGTDQRVQVGQTAWMVGEQDGYAAIVWACAPLWITLGAIE
jgi:hypothetical protein